LFDSSAAVIAVSKHMVNQLQKLGCPIKKIHYISCGVDLIAFNNAKPELATAQFICVGRFVDKKAPHLTLIAFKDVLIEVPEAKLVMFGDGPLLNACITLTKALGIDTNVTFYGIRPQQDICELMKQSRGFIQHSITALSGDSEGTPVSILEAGGAGLPIISTFHGGIPDAVINEKTGFLVSEGDTKAMANAILKLAKDSKLAEKMGKAAREYIQLNFSMDKNIEKLYSVIKSTVRNLT
jgi:colanic acid/amylovoran biosynthesis glycosyltransferase